MKFLNYLGDFCEYFIYIIKNLMPYFVVMACLKYLTIVNFEYNELKRKHKALLTEQAILNGQLETLKKEVGESK